jgi:hypothetical protein
LRRKRELERGKPRERAGEGEKEERREEKRREEEGGCSLAPNQT